MLKIMEIIESHNCYSQPNKNLLTDAPTIWEEARGILSQEIPASTFKTWLEPLNGQLTKDGRFLLTGPNNFFLNWVKGHFINEIVAALSKAGLNQANSELIDFVADPSATFSAASNTDTLAFNPSPPKNVDEGGKAHKSSYQAKPATYLVSSQPLAGGGRFSFDNFVVGDSNIYAFSAAKAMSAGESLGSDALFITSDHGLGKSHLSLALSQCFLAHSPRNRVYYLTAEDFTNEMTYAIRHSQMEDFKARYRHNCDVLVLEEVQFLAGKEKIQSELCFTLDCLMEKGKKIVFTSPQEPKNIPRLGRSLRSRLSTALISPIGPPDYETRLKILLKKAKNIGLKVSKPILEYVAEGVTSDVRQLESCLISLNAKSQLLARQVDMEMVRETLSYVFDDQGQSTLTPLLVRSTVCRHFQVDPAEVTSRARTSRITEARSLGIYLARQLTGRTLEEIGSTFGRSHSSALYAINKLEKQMQKDAKLKGKIEFFSTELFK
ncbi:MAG: chromosomal replication initiator protein DnaA [Candidatus Adiutrix sp.]